MVSHIDRIFVFSPKRNDNDSPSWSSLSTINDYEGDRIVEGKFLAQHLLRIFIPEKRISLSFLAKNGIETSLFFDCSVIL